MKAGERRQGNVVEIKGTYTAA